MNTLNEGPDTSPIDVAEVRAAVEAALTADGLTKKQIAAESGVAEGTFGPWLSGTYQGDNERVARQAKRWLDLREDRLAAAAVMPAPPRWQPTPTGKAITGVLSRAQTAGDLVLIGAGAGTGKTATSRNYAATRPNVTVVQMRPSTRGVNTCLVAILQAMGDPTAKGTPQALADRIIAKVRDVQALIIVDEAQQLSIQAIEELRSIHDITGCGLAFVGDERLYQIFGGNRSGEFAQLTSRIGFRLRQARPKPDDARVLASAHGITDPKLISLCCDISQQPGALRGLTKVLLIARQTAATRGVELSEQLVRAAWQSLAPDQQVRA